MRVTNHKLEIEEVLEIRKEVLAQWPTGAEVDLEEAAAYRAGLALDKNCATRFARAKKEGKIILLPQFGRATFEQTLTGMQYVEQQSGNDGIWLVYPDPYTRKGRFDRAAAGVEASHREGMSMLSGWPIVNYGVGHARKLQESIGMPIINNSTDEDSRLQTEISLAAGWSGYSTRGLQEVTAHCKNIPLDRMIWLNQYESRLAAFYTEKGFPVLAINAANLTGYDIAGYRLITVLTQILLAAEQGVKHIWTEIGLGMNMVQDVAMLRALAKLGQRYLDELGYGDVTLTIGTFPYLGDWPRDVEGAQAMIAWNATIGILAGVEGMLIKCVDEAFSTPTKEGMAAAVKIARQLLRIVGMQILPRSPELELEQAMIEREVEAVMAKIHELGDGDLVQGMVKGVEIGIIDTVFSPWRFFKSKVLVVRDMRNAVRYLDAGNIPLPAEVREYHREKIADREHKEGTKANLDMVIKDITWASEALL